MSRWRAAEGMCPVEHGAGFRGYRGSKVEPDPELYFIFARRVPLPPFFVTADSIGVTARREGLMLILEDLFSAFSVLRRKC